MKLCHLIGMSVSLLTFAISTVGYASDREEKPSCETRTHTMDYKDTKNSDEKTVKTYVSVRKDEASKTNSESKK